MIEIQKFPYWIVIAVLWFGTVACTSSNDSQHTNIILGKPLAERQTLAFENSTLRVEIRVNSGPVQSFTIFPGQNTLTASVSGVIENASNNISIKWTELLNGFDVEISDQTQTFIADGSTQISAPHITDQYDYDNDGATNSEERSAGTCVWSANEICLTAGQADVPGSNGVNTNLLPVAQDDFYLLFPGALRTITPTENDFDAEGGSVTSIEITREPQHGLISVQSGLALGYRWLDANASNITSDSFDYRVTDAFGGSADATVIVGKPRGGSDLLVPRRMPVAPIIDGKFSAFEYQGAIGGVTPVIPIEGLLINSLDEIIKGLQVGYDDRFFYLATRIDKDVFYTDSNPLDGTLWNDDSFEIYFDLGNEGNAGYDSNDYLGVFGFTEGNPAFVASTFNQITLTHLASCDDTGDGTAVICEVRFELAETGLLGPGERTFGFDLQWSLDFDGGERDAKYSWCAGESPGNPVPDVINAFQDISTIPCNIVLPE